MSRVIFLKKEVKVSGCSGTNLDRWLLGSFGFSDKRLRPKFLKASF
jgi:hypothetical protein